MDQREWMANNFCVFFVAINRHVSQRWAIKSKVWFEGRLRSAKKILTIGVGISRTTFYGKEKLLLRK